jgi:hypothetical protein
MKATTLRVAFAGLLLATIIGKMHGPRVDRDLDATVFTVLADQGLSPRRMPSEPGAAPMA